MLTDFGVYLTIAIIVSSVFIFIAWLFGTSKGRFTGLELLIGWFIWVAVIVAICWVLHMVAIGAGYI